MSPTAHQPWALNTHIIKRVLPPVAQSGPVARTPAQMLRGNRDYRLDFRRKPSVSGLEIPGVQARMDEAYEAVRANVEVEVSPYPNAEAGRGTVAVARDLPA